jgi:phage shock protein PspC (stress-responsive transcriptional regulator)
LVSCGFDTVSAVASALLNLQNIPRNLSKSTAYVYLEIIERSANMNTEYKQLTRSTSNRMIAGVCAGLGDYFGIDPTIVRLLTLLAFFTGFGGIALVYLIMALVVPEQTQIVE